MNCSKLNEAQSLLKVLEVYESRATTNQENEKSMEL